MWTAALSVLPIRTQALLFLVCKTLLETGASVTYFLLSCNILAQMCLSTHIAKITKGFAAIAPNFYRCMNSRLKYSKNSKKSFPEISEDVKSVSGGWGAGAIKDRCCFHPLKRFSPGEELEWRHPAEVSWRKLTLEVEGAMAEKRLPNLQTVTPQSNFVNHEEALEEEIWTLLPSLGSCSCNLGHADFETEILFLSTSYCLKV